MQNNKKVFATYVGSLSQDSLNNLLSLYKAHVKGSGFEPVDDQHFLSNPYLHQLTQLVSGYYADNSAAPSNTAFQKEPFYDTIIVSHYSSIFLGENVSGEYSKAAYDIVYGTIKATDSIAGLGSLNFSGYVMLYSIRLENHFGFECIGWHKDMLLDIAEHRSRHHLKKFKVDTAESNHYKLYSDNEQAANQSLSADFFENLAVLANLDGESPRPLDFSIEGNQLSIITRTVEVPFGLAPAFEGSDVSVVKEDLNTVNKHVEAVRAIIGSLR